MISDSDIYAIAKVLFDKMGFESASSLVAKRINTLSDLGDSERVADLWKMLAALLDLT